MLSYELRIRKHACAYHSRNLRMCFALTNEALGACQSLKIYENHLESSSIIMA